MQYEGTQVILDRKYDSLYLLISKIRENETIYINEYEIHLNEEGIYEIKSKDKHLYKYSIEDCFLYLKKKCGVNLY